jgi:hypothetical protein
MVFPRLCGSVFSLAPRGSLLGCIGALGARVISIGLLCAACSSRSGEPSEPTADLTSRDAALSDADADPPGETHRIDAGRTHPASETRSFTSSGGETLESIDAPDAQAQFDASESQAEQTDAPRSQTTQSQTSHSGAAQPDTTGLGPKSDGGGTSCAVELDESVAEHACFHISYGPFAAVAAGTDAAVADLTQTHTAYVVTLPDATAAGVVGLRLPRTGLYAMFLDVALPLIVNDGSNVVTPAHAQPVRGCDAFAELALYVLEAGRQYNLWLGPGATQVQLVFEQTYPEALNETCSEQTDVSRDSGITSSRETSSPEVTSMVQTVASNSSAGASTSSSEVSTEVSSASTSSEVTFASTSSEVTFASTSSEVTFASTSSEVETCRDSKSACLTPDECCSGRCYARQCVTLECRTSGYCENDEECCSYCHFGDSPHCH